MMIKNRQNVVVTHNALIDTCISDDKNSIYKQTKFIEIEFVEMKNYSVVPLL